MSDDTEEIIIRGAAPAFGKVAMIKRLKEELGIAVVDGELQAGGDIGELEGALGIGGEQPSVVGGSFHAGEEHEGKPMGGVPGVNHAGDRVSKSGVADDLIKDATLAGDGANLRVIGDELGSVGEVVHESHSGCAGAETQPSTTEVQS